MRKIVGEFLPPKPPSPAAWAILGLLVVSSIAAWTAVAVQVVETRRARAEIARIEADAAARPQSQNAAVQIPPWDASARVVLAQAKSRWPDALTTLEKTYSKDISLTALNINVPGDTITVELVFDDYPGLLTFIERLNASESTVHWQLTQAQVGTGTPSQIPAGSKRAESRATVVGRLARR